MTKYTKIEQMVHEKALRQSYSLDRFGKRAVKKPWLIRLYILK